LPTRDIMNPSRHVLLTCVLKISNCCLGIFWTILWPGVLDQCFPNCVHLATCFLSCPWYLWNQLRVTTAPHLAHIDREIEPDLGLKISAPAFLPMYHMGPLFCVAHGCQSTLLVQQSWQSIAPFAGRKGRRSRVSTTYDPS
jgi:hypothetical protein